MVDDDFEEASLRTAYVGLREHIRGQAGCNTVSIRDGYAGGISCRDDRAIGH